MRTAIYITLGGILFDLFVVSLYPDLLPFWMFLAIQTLYLIILLVIVITEKGLKAIMFNPLEDKHDQPYKGLVGSSWDFSDPKRYVRLLVNGKSVDFKVRPPATVNVPTARWKRLYRRLLGRPQWDTKQVDEKVIELKTAPPAGSMMVMEYTTDLKGSFSDAVSVKVPNAEADTQELIIVYWVKNLTTGVMLINRDQTALAKVLYRACEESAKTPLQAIVLKFGTMMMTEAEYLSRKSKQ